jgi:hypothetical protein
MKLPRLTVRRLMILVALGALASYAAYLVRRSEAFRAEADRHRLAWVSPVAWLSLIDRDTRVPAKADYHHAMKWKYERAARYPWLPVEPDPPEPE